MAASFLVSVLFGLQVYSIQGVSEEIEVGNCLGIEDLYEQLGVYKMELYTVGECGDAHGSEGVYEESLTCGENYQAGNWDRVVREHKAPGFWWPRPVPCMASVTGAVSEVQLLVSKDAEVCSAEQSYVSDYYYERLMSRKYKAGQGELYLPDPLAIFYNTYGFDSEAGHFEETCRQTYIRGSYDGYLTIDLKREVIEGCPGQTQETSCQVYSVGQGEDSEGNTCALVKAIKSCN